MAICLLLFLSFCLGLVVDGVQYRLDLRLSNVLVCTWKHDLYTGFRETKMLLNGASDLLSETASVLTYSFSYFFLGVFLEIEFFCSNE